MSAATQPGIFFGINFATNAEPAADVTFVELNEILFPPQHVRDSIAIPVRHLGGTMQLQNIACFIVACDSAARFKRNAGVAPNGKLKRDNGVGVAEGGIDIAIRLLQDSRLCREFTLIGARLSGGAHRCWLGLDRKRDQLSCVFREICVVRKHHSDWLADIAHDILRQHRLAVWFELLQPGQPERDQWNLLRHRHASTLRGSPVA